MASLMAVVAVTLLLLATSAQAQPLSAGDRLQVTVEAGEEFSGRFQLDQQVRLHLPYAGPVGLIGLDAEAAGGVVAQHLVQSSLFKPGFARATVQVVAWAPLPVHVSGAVFSPGAHRINLPTPARDRSSERSEELPGAMLPERRLSDALRAAGGVTPWADVANLGVRRNGHTRLYDLRHLLDGRTGDDPLLHARDEVIVPLRDRADTGLLRPSPITPPGIKIFASNLIQPATSNSAATVGGGQLSLAYGARLSQAVIAANCVGGIAPTSASRQAMLVRTDRSDGHTRQWVVPVEAVVRETSDERNPFLLEGDAITCYDSTVTGIRDVFRALADIVLPFTLLRWLP